MARPKNDGKGRMGGRAKGTPNKVTSTLKEWLLEVVNSNRKQMEQDLKELEPRERLQILERLLPYIIPKQQAVSAVIDYDKLSEEQIDNIVAEVTKGIDGEEVEDED